MLGNTAQTNSDEPGFRLRLPTLPRQIHIPLTLQLPEIGIGEVDDVADRLAGTLHLRAEVFVHVGKFVEAKHRHLGGEAAGLGADVDFELLVPLII